MSERWEIFEANATDYLNSKINIPGINFKTKGGSDSTISDIEVLYDEKLIFIIEAKLVPCQSGQFVVHLNEGTFKFSDLNKEENNEFSKLIISFMNKNKEKYLKLGTKGINIECSEDIFINWIVNHYRNKKVNSIITSTEINNFDNNFIKIFPLSDFKKYFTVTATYRIKKSGSRKIPKSDYTKVNKLLTDIFPNKFALKENGELTFQNLSPKKQKLGDNFFLSIKEGNYSVRKLSNTYNANVIFSLSLKDNETSVGLGELKSKIISLIK
jgi:hypothetical protein